MATDYIQGIAVDPAGHAYVTGKTDSDQTTFPVKVGPDLTHNASDDGFVAKVNPQGTGFVYCGFLGGSGADYCEGIAADASGHAYVTGRTPSDEQTFPVKVGPDLTHNGGNDVFVAKVNPQGTGFVYCGYIGGSGNDSGYGIAVDAAGNAHVAGLAASSHQTFPVMGGPDLTHNGGDDAFVARVNPQGTGLDSCGYIGGSSHESAYGIAVDAAGSAYVAGRTPSSHQTFPVTVGPDLTHNGGNDVFVARISVTVLTGGGAPRPGGRVDLALTASGDAGLSYQTGSSLGTGPIPIDARRLNLGLDDLLRVSVTGLWPTIFSGYPGVLDGQGQARAAIHIPNLAGLIGIRIHTAFVTLDPQAPSGVRSISNTFSFTVTK